jgi:hypothetical protein
MGRAMGVSVPRPLEGGSNPAVRKKNLITNIKLWPQASYQAWKRIPS